MANIKNPKNPNPRGQVAVSLEELYPEVVKIAKNENRSVNRQIAVIIREWIQSRKAQQNNTASSRQ